MKVCLLFMSFIIAGVVYAGEIKTSKYELAQKAIAENNCIAANQYLNDYMNENTEELKKHKKFHQKIKKQIKLCEEQINIHASDNEETSNRRRVFGGF